jgi:hypothetical protein
VRYRREDFRASQKGEEVREAVLRRQAVRLSDVRLATLLGNPRTSAIFNCHSLPHVCVSDIL